MQIRTINISDIGISKNTQYGKKRLEVIQNMINKGCKIIKEYENQNAYVYFGYINKYVTLANYAARVNDDGSYEETYTRKMRSPFPSSMQTIYLKKTTHDRDGFTNILEKTTKTKGGEIVSEQECRVKYKTETEADSISSNN